MFEYFWTEGEGYTFSLPFYATIRSKQSSGVLACLLLNEAHRIIRFVVAGGREAAAGAAGQKEGRGGGTAGS